MNRREAIGSLVAASIVGIPMARSIVVRVEGVVTEDTARSIAEALREVIENSGK